MGRLGEERGASRSETPSAWNSKQKIPLVSPPLNRNVVVVPAGFGGRIHRRLRAGRCWQLRLYTPRATHNRGATMRASGRHGSKCVRMPVFFFLVVQFCFPF